MVVETDADGRVVKASMNDDLPGEKMVYTDLMIIDRNLLMYIIENSTRWGVTSFSRDILSNTKDYKIYSYEHDGYYAAVNSLIDYYRHSMELLDPNVVRELFYKGGAEIYTKVRDSAPAKFTDTAQVTDSMIADGCIIEGEVENSIIFRNCHIAKGAKICQTPSSCRTPAWNRAPPSTASSWIRTRTSWKADCSPDTRPILIT